MSDNPYDKYMTDSKTSDIYLEQHKDEVLLKLTELGVSYPSELARSTQIPIESVNKILNYFISNDFIRKIRPDRWSPQPVFRVRLQELWSMGLMGYERFSICSWWIPTVGAIEYVKEKYKGQKKQIRGALITQLELEHPELKKAKIK